MEIKTTKKIIRHQDKLWQRRNNNNPAFKSQGQTEFTYKDYDKLVEEADKFNDSKWISFDDLIADIIKLEGKRITDNNDYISIPMKDWLDFKDKLSNSRPTGADNVLSIIYVWN